MCGFMLHCSNQRIMNYGIRVPFYFSEQNHIDQSTGICLSDVKVLIDFQNI